MIEELRGDENRKRVILMWKWEGLLRGWLTGVVIKGKEGEGALGSGSIESAGERNAPELRLLTMGFAGAASRYSYISIVVNIYIYYIYKTCTCATSQYQLRRAKPTRVGLGQVYPSSTLCHQRNPRRNELRELTKKFSICSVKISWFFNFNERRTF